MDFLTRRLAALVAVVVVTTTATGLAVPEQQAKDTPEETQRRPQQSLLAAAAGPAAPVEQARVLMPATVEMACQARSLDRRFKGLAVVVVAPRHQEPLDLVCLAEETALPRSVLQQMALSTPARAAAVVRQKEHQPVEAAGLALSSSGIR